ncbi:hypothetical protein NMY22_g5717 [Coprinellus aureogranulatus]|nr:hypothetical protein NMY22_g5717 [Coprinellus aureogranulatus]
MPSWRFSRSSTSPSDSCPSSSTMHDASDNAPLPPRYSHLAPTESEGAQSPASYSYHARHISLESNGTAPSYATYDNAEVRSISPTVATASNPPRYSRVIDGGPVLGGSQSEAHSREHTFGILGGNDLEPWAILHLYDAASSSSRSSRKRKYPRFSGQDKMIGNVELSLASPQTIRSIKLIVCRSSIFQYVGNVDVVDAQLKGTIEVGSEKNAFRYLGSKPTAFLDHVYTIWDRKFGDPRDLAHDTTQPSSKKYDGKLAGNWIFPFCIPFPDRIDLPTMCAIYQEDGHGPVRFLPQLLQRELSLSPFHVDGPPAQGEGDLHSDPRGSDGITPFDTRRPYRPVEKGRPRFPDEDHHPSLALPHYSPISPAVSRASPVAPSPEPFLLGQIRRSNSSPPENEYTSKCRPQSVSIGAIGDFRAEKGSKMRSERPSSGEIGSPVPQSFFERNVMANVHYQLTLSISHGMFSTESRVKTNVVYMPTTVPEPMGPKRRAAYRHKKLPPNPEVDPDGWAQLPLISIKGTYLHQKALTVHYCLHLAKPLSFARGSVIPCFLTITCDDSGALDLFAEPRTPCVRLKRLIRVRPDRSGFSNPDSKRPRTTAEDENAPTEGVYHSPDDYDETEVGKGALWCLPPGYTQEPHRRTLYGELHLPRGLQPTCKFPLFSILYRVELLAPMVNAFVFVPDMQLVSSSRKGKGKGKDGWEGEYVYASQFVDITTDVREGDPLAVSFIKD